MAYSPDRCPVARLDPSPTRGFQDAGRASPGCPWSLGSVPGVEFGNNTAIMPRSLTAQVNTLNDNRPVNLDLSTIHFPITAIVSILTRISGVALFVTAAAALWLLDLSLSGEAGFREAREWLANPLVKAAAWAVLVAAIYHALAGLKHIVADFGIGESLKGGVLGSWLVIVLSVALALAAGLWLW